MIRFRLYALKSVPATISILRPTTGFTTTTPPTTTTRQGAYYTKRRWFGTKPYSYREDIVHSSDNLEFYHLKRTVDSTQEEAKRILNDNNNNNKSQDYDKQFLALVADGQTNGRGTGGRVWHSSQGNLLLTCAIASELIPLPMLTLLPIGVGVCIVEMISQYSRQNPVVKWPNDVLFEGQKVAGTLIENHSIEGKCWMLVGVGVNIESHPMPLPPEENDFHKVPRNAASLRDMAARTTTEEEGAASILLPTTAEFGLELTSRIRDLICNDFVNNNEAAATTIVEKWKTWSDIDNIGSEYHLRETGEVVVPLGIEADGSLRVLGQNGKERFLIADYLF